MAVVCMSSMGMQHLQQRNKELELFAQGEVWDQVKTADHLP